MTGNMVGQIWLTKPADKDLKRGEKPNPVLAFPVYIDGPLNGVGDSHSDYWYTIPNCDAITIEERQQAGDSVKSQNQLTHLLQ